MDPEYLPLVLVRAEQTWLGPNIEQYQTDLQAIFGQPLEVSYDLRAIFQLLSKDPYAMGKLNGKMGALCRTIPSSLDVYFKSAISALSKSLNFKHDELYRSAFLAAAPKGIMFEVVKELQTVSSFDSLSLS
jgi:hypothetical protein